MTHYNVIDIDPGMHYAEGEDVIGTVPASSPEEAIATVMQAIGIDILKASSPTAYAVFILRNVKAEEVA